MNTCYSVIGEHQADPDRLLLLGDDGLFYEFHLPDGPTLPTEPNASEWAVDSARPATDDPLA